MSSLETRSNSALFKRADQLKRWEESDTNREPVSPKQKLRKIKFSSGCVFLAACAAAEKDEVIRLLEQGADIDTANVDGLTALHQACIDDNLDMVEFLVERGADVNRGDNEGWTALHATASCGFLSIAKYLLEHGGNVAAVNCDGELALDIAESAQMEELLQGEIDERGVDCDLARNEEKRLMMHDALEWFKTKNTCVNECSPKTGATPLHVACAKGYVDVIKVLLQCVDVDVDKQDVDGWTPLHAAAHWGQREASQLLAENLADMHSKNYVGQTAFDVADSEMYNHLDELNKAQNHDAVSMRRRRKQGLPSKRPDFVGSLDTDTDKTPVKVQRLDEQTINQDKLTDSVIINNAEVIEKKNRANAQTNQNMDNLSSKTPQVGDNDKVVEKSPIKSPVVQIPPEEPPRNISVRSDDANKQREKDINERYNKLEKEARESQQGVGLKPSKSFNSKDKDVNEVKLRKNYSFQNDPLFYERYREVRARIQATSSLSNAVYSAQLMAPASTYIIPPSVTATPTMGTPINCTDEQINQTRQSPLWRHSDPTGRENDHQTRSESLSLNLSAITSAGSVDGSCQVRSSPTSPTHPSISSPATSPVPNNPSMKIRSFVPPVRDEESETQRKAKAKKVRETRRSTQGVTLEEIKSAEQLVKNNQINNNNNENTTSAATDICVTATITQITTAAPTVAHTTTATTTTTTTTTTTSSPTNTSSSSRHDSVASLSGDVSDLAQSSAVSVAAQERRPSWRLRLDNGSKFKLEDVATAPDQQQQQPASPTSDAPPTTTTNSSSSTSASFIRRSQQNVQNHTTSGNTATTRPSSAAPVLDGSSSSNVAVTAEATVTLPLRSRLAASTSLGKTSSAVQTGDDKDQDKENDARNAHQASIPTQAAIQRRKRSKRRSTGGVVQFDSLEQDLELEKDNNSGGGGGGDFLPEGSTKLNHQAESGTERSVGSRSSSRNDLTSLTARCENGDIDYKRLYEQAITENDRLKDKLRKSDEELRDTKQTLERLNTVTSKNSLSELEKRERRAMERKLSEMEEELKQLQKLKAENERLRAENRALTRVVSKLSNSVTK